MKKLVLLSVLCLLLGDRAHAQSRSDREAAGLAGRVQSVHTETVMVWKAPSGEIKELDKYGIGTTAYDEQGKIIKEEPRRLESGYSDNLRRERKTDSDGRAIEDSAYLRDGSLLRRRIYAFDSNGNRIEAASYDHLNHLEFKWTKIYDSNGRVLEATRYDRNGTQQGRLDHREVNSYDDKGNNTDEKWYGADTRLLHWWTNTYEYDSNGNWVKRMFYKRVIDGQELPFEPSEITYRTITYY